jgi:hypothetical protein
MSPCLSLDEGNSGVSLGIVTAPGEWLELLGAVALLCATGVVVNRWAGITYPLWSPPVPVLNEACEPRKNTLAITGMRDPATSAAAFQSVSSVSGAVSST